MGENNLLRSKFKIEELRELQGGKKGNKHMFMEIPGDLNVDEVLMQKSEGETENSKIKYDNITGEATGKRCKKEHSLGIL